MNRKEIRYVVVPTKEEIKELERKYAGRTIELIEMKDDLHPVPPGTQGKCSGIDGIGNLMMEWDTGSTLNLIEGVDLFVVEPTAERGHEASAAAAADYRKTHGLDSHGKKIKEDK